MISSAVFFVTGLAAVLVLGGCGREKVRVYTAPKDQAVETSALSEPGTGTAGRAPGEATGDEVPEKRLPERARPVVKWTLPAGWVETAGGQMSVAQFAVKTADGEATVNVTPLPNLKGKEAMIVNMWREQVGQKPMGEGELAGALVPVPVAEGDGQLFEIAGTREGAATRIVTAMLHRVDGSWFFKLSGSEAAVAAQKPVFLEFLKTVRIGAPPDAVEAAPAKDSQP